MKINLTEEIEIIKSKQKDLLLKLIEEAKKVDGTYKGAVAHLLERRGIFLYKNDREAVEYLDEALVYLKNDLEERTCLLMDYKIY